MSADVCNDDVKLVFSEIDVMRVKDVSDVTSEISK